MKKPGKWGFTLAELLVVIAIIAILVSIAVSVFALQLEKAREAADLSNARAASEMAEADFLLEHTDLTGVTRIVYGFGTDIDGNLCIISIVDQKGNSIASTCSNVYRKIDNPDVVGFINPQSKKLKDLGITRLYVTVDFMSLKITNNNWLKYLN